MGWGLTISIDVSEVKSREALHFLLREAFGFPKYYGMNWDAFDECIRDFSPGQPVVVSGLSTLAESMPKDAELLKVGLIEAQQDMAGFEVRFR